MIASVSSPFDRLRLSEHPHVLLAGLLALNAVYPVLVVVERLLTKAGIGALRMIWPRYSPSLGDYLQWGLLTAAIVVGIGAIARRRSPAAMLLALVAVGLLVVHVLHPHLRVSASPLIETARHLFPGLNAAQGQKLLAAAGIWLVMMGVVLLAAASTRQRVERRMAKLTLVALLLIGVVGGMGDFLGMLLDRRLFAAGTLFGLLEEGSELAGASFVLLVQVRLARGKEEADPAPA